MIQIAADLSMSIVTLVSLDRVTRIIFLHIVTILRLLSQIKMVIRRLHPQL